MKNKTKKLLAGIGLGLIGATTLTGCASDIVFNQKDLDKAINGINNYLETQNNYSSEFARNMLNDSIVRAVFKAMETDSYSMKNTQIVKDALGNLIDEQCSDCNVFYNHETNKAKIHNFYSINGEITDVLYKEVEFVPAENPNDDPPAYKVKTFDLDAKTYTEIINDEYRSEAEYMSLQSMLNNFLIQINGSDIIGDVVMDRIDENTNEFFFSTYSKDGEDSASPGLETYMHYQFRFVGDELTYMRGALSQGDDVSYLHAVAECFIEWNISDLNVINEADFSKVDSE